MMMVLSIHAVCEMPETVSLTASLVLAKPPACDVPRKPLLSAMCAALKTSDALRTEPTVSRSQRIMRGDSLELRLDVETDSARIHLTIAPISQDMALNEDRAADILAHAILKMLSVCDVREVVWLEEGIILGRDAFIELRTYVSPRRNGAGRRGPALPRVDGWESASDTYRRLYGSAKDRPEAGRADHDKAPAPQSGPPRGLGWLFRLMTD